MKTHPDQVHVSLLPVPASLAVLWSRIHMMVKTCMRKTATRRRLTLRLMTFRKRKSQKLKFRQMMLRKQKSQKLMTLQRANNNSAFAKLPLQT